MFKRIIVLLLQRAGFVPDEDLRAAEQQLHQANELVMRLSMRNISLTRQLRREEESHAVTGKQLGEMLGNQANTIMRLTEECELLKFESRFT